MFVTSPAIIIDSYISLNTLLGVVTPQLLKSPGFLKTFFTSFIGVLVNSFLAS